MTTVTETRSVSPSRARLPRSAVVAGALTLLMSTVGGYGAIYFTGLEGWDDFGATYVTTYEYLALTGLVSAVALLRGHHLGWVGALWYAAFQVAFTTFKLVSIQETEASLFGVASLVVIVLLTRPSVRAHFTR